MEISGSKGNKKQRRSNRIEIPHCSFAFAQDMVRNDTFCQIEYTLLNLTNKKYIYKLYTNLKTMEGAENA